MKLVQHVCLDELSHKFEKLVMSDQKLGHCVILEKPCVCSRGHIFSQIMMKLSLNFYLDKISDE